MMRHQLPVRSPLPWLALWSGVRSATRRDHGARARAEVAALLRSRFRGFDVLFTDSGTSALALAIGRSAHSARRPIAVPAFGCFDLATAVDAAGAPFVLYDVDPATLGPDLESLERATALGADRILVAHLYGIPVDIVAVHEIAKRAGAVIIDDAAQGAGASVQGIPLGAGGEFGILSFGRGKGITGGGGGALLCRSDLHPNDPLATTSVRPASRTAAKEFATGLAQWLLGRPELYWIPASLPFLGLGETDYRAPHPVSDATDFSLGVLRETLPLADAEADLRRRHATRLQRALSPVTLASPRIPRDAVPGFLRFPVLASSAKAITARSIQARRLGIMPAYPTALVDLAGFGDRRLNRDEACEGARTLAGRLLTLPVHGALNEADLCALESWCRGPV